VATSFTWRLNSLTVRGVRHGAFETFDGLPEFVDVRWDELAGAVFVVPDPASSFLWVGFLIFFDGGAMFLADDGGFAVAAHVAGGAIKATAAAWFTAGAVHGLARRCSKHSRPVHFFG